MKTRLPALGIHSSLSFPSSSHSSPARVPWKQELVHPNKHETATMHKSSWSCANHQPLLYPLPSPLLFSASTPACVLQRKAFTETHHSWLVVLVSISVHSSGSSKHTCIFFPWRIIITQIELASKHPTKLSIKHGWEHHRHRILSKCEE